jgi:hypothetical protein
MKKIVGVVGALVALAGAAPAAKADPCDPPAPTYVQPTGETYIPAEYNPYGAPPPAPVVVRPRYDTRYRIWEARRAELARERWEAYRRWRWHHRGEYVPLRRY